VSNEKPPASSSDLNAVVLVKMIVENLDYERLRSLGDVQARFQRGVAGAIAYEAGHGMKADEIQVKLAPGSVHVSANINKLTGAEAMRLQSKLVSSALSLRALLTSSISQVAGIDKACTGTVTVTQLQARAEAVVPSLSEGNSRAKVIAACLFGACFCPLVGLLVWQHQARNHSREDSTPGPLGAKGTSNEEPSQNTPLVANADSPEATGQQGEQQTKATEAETSAEPQADKIEEKVNEDPQQPSPHPSQKSVEDKKKNEEPQQDYSDVKIRILCGEHGSLETYTPEVPTALIIPGTNLKTNLIPLLGKFGAETGEYKDVIMPAPERQEAQEVKWQDAYKVRLYTDIAWHGHEVVCVAVANFPHPRAYSECSDQIQPFEKERPELYNDKYRVAMDAIRQHCPHTIESFAAVVMGMSLTHSKEDDKSLLLNQLVPKLRNYLAQNRPGQSRITRFDFLCHDKTWVEALSLEAGDSTEIVE